MSEQVNLQEALVKKAAFGNDIDLEKFDDIYQVYYADLDKKIDEIDTSSPEMNLYVDKLINAWG